MGCVLSAPKVKETKSPSSKVVADGISSSSQRRPAASSNAVSQPPASITAAPAPADDVALPGTEPPTKDQPVLAKVPSSKIRPSAPAPVPPEEVPEKKKERPAVEPVPRPVPKNLEGEQIAAGWPSWLASVASEAIKGWVPRRADSFEKLDKIGQGTYSNVYKARDLESGKLVALKKVRFDNLEPESVRFMAREIEVLRRLDHPNIVKLEGLVTSRMSCSLYLVFEYMEHDLAGLAASPGITFTEAQVKCYMKQLLSGLEHCHTNGVLHRDIKGSNLLLDNSGTLKIADFGLATFYRPEQNVPLTSRVVTLWYRPPELLLGATNYGVAVDLWSAGCILAELLAGKPIMPGRTEVEQLHKIFKLCGSPSEDYWRKSKLPHATIFKPSQPYKRNLKDIFKDFPATSLALLDILLAIEPADRSSATAALIHEFFTTEPLPCDPSSLPEYPPSKEYDAKLRDEEARRSKAAGSRARGAADKEKRNTTSLVQQTAEQRASKAVPAPHANAELMESIAIQKQHMSKHTSGPVAKSSSERFMGDSSQGQKAGVPSGLPSHTGVSSAQFKNIDTPEAVVPGNRQADRVLHRTGTNTRIGSMGPGGAVNMSGGWGAAQQGQAGNGGASIGKYPPGAPGADMGDRALSMARMGNKGAAKDLAGGLQAGDVSFTLQKKAEGEHSVSSSVPRNRTQTANEKDLDLSFQGGNPSGKPTAPAGGAAGAAPALGSSAGSSSSRKSGPLGPTRDKAEAKAWTGQAPGALPSGAAPAREAASLPAGEAGAVNGTVDASPPGKGSAAGSGGGAGVEELARPKSRGRDFSPSKDKLGLLTSGSPKDKEGKGPVEVSPRGRSKGGPAPDTIGNRSRKGQGGAASSLVVGPDPSLGSSSRGR